QRSSGERSPLDVNEMIREVDALMHREMVRRTVAVKLELAENLPAILGDRIQLQQIILNLIINGAQAMQSLEGASRELIIRSSASESGDVIVAVQDAGIGIDPKTVNQVFEPFFTTKAGGLGMGLAISKRIVVAHGGRIWASSNPEQG